MLNWILCDSSRTVTDKETIIMPRVPDSEAFVDLPVADRAHRLLQLAASART